MSKIQATIRKSQKKEKKENEDINHYVDNVDFSSELPRLIAQAKVVFKLLAPFFEQSKEYVKDDGVFLDIGAGPGVVTELLTEKYFVGYSVKALELSKPMIDFGRVASHHIDWYQGNVYNMPFEDNSIDVIFSSLVLMHLDSPDRAVSEIARVLKKGGMAFIFNPNYYANQGSSQLFQDLYSNYADFVRSRDEGDYGIMSYLSDLMLKKGIYLLENDNIISTNKGKKESIPEIDYPFFNMGKMTYWSIISYISQREDAPKKVKEIYSSCAKEYMKNNISVYARQPIHLYQKGHC